MEGLEIQQGGDEFQFPENEEYDDQRYCHECAIHCRQRELRWVSCLFVALILAIAQVIAKWFERIKTPAR
jgi:hypothetical protein